MAMPVADFDALINYSAEIMLRSTDDVKGTLVLDGERIDYVADTFYAGIFNPDAVALMVQEINTEVPFFNVMLIPCFSLVWFVMHDREVSRRCEWGAVKIKMYFDLGPG